MTKNTKVTLSLGILVTIGTILVSLTFSAARTYLKVDSHDTEFIEIKTTIDKNEENNHDKFHALQQENKKQTEVLTEIKTDIKWIKESIQNGN